MEQLEKVVVLGTGHRSTVWLVRRDSDKLALKEVAKTGLTDIEVKHLFNEKAAFSALRHPSIISLTSTFQDSDHIYFLMSVAPGAPLSYLLSRHVLFTETQVQNIVRQVADALGYMRAQGYIYRDLKLSNVFWDDKGTVTLVDLGFCKKIAGERTFTVCGTRHMMSPEIFRHLVEGGEPVGYGYECDYWALGIMAYELLKSKPPFGLTEDNIYERVLRGLEEVDFSGISNTAKGFITSLLRPDPEARLGHSGADEICTHEWIRDALLPALPTSEQALTMHDWCEFLSDDEALPADAEDAFAGF